MIHIDIQKPLHGSNGQMSLDVKLDIQEGEFVALTGESGAGKTTLLRVLAGLESSQGHITVNGQSWNTLAPQKRNIGFVFQDYALFDNMTVEENLLFVNNDKKLAKELLEITALESFKKRNVKTLSGGQKQRVSLCRAMMNRPKILLMDEPFSALDSLMKATLQKEIKKLHKTFGTTTIMVSHDMQAIAALADRVWVLEQGKVISDTLVQDLMQSKSQKAEVIKLKVLADKVLATIFVAGEFLEVEVAKDVQLSDTITLELSAKLSS
ncbi:MAG: ABC transporter ATP-binding protein [Epsilonproteobacteria bacterium]|nr:MAG: ABC transporter ATP-binding protein [Campylobacterota bacterium]